MIEFVSCRVEQSAGAIPEVVYDILMNVDRWADWMPTVSAASWERHGSSDAGIGGIRRVRAGIVVTRDRVVDGARPHHHAYTASLPRWWLINDFRGEVHIEEVPDGSVIVWTVRYRTAVPGLGRMMQPNVRRTYRRIAAGLALEAERTGPNVSASGE